MAFEGLSGKLNSVFGKLKGRGKLNEKDIKDAMREVRMALLDADVNYKVAKDFVARVSEKAVGRKGHGKPYSGAAGHRHSSPRTH